MRTPILLPPDRELAALLPVYDDCGEATRVVLLSGEELLVPRTLRSVIKNIARRGCKDIPLCRAWSARVTHRSLNNPVPISAELVLLPFKARLPRVPGDEVMGFVNPYTVAEIVPRRLKPLPRDLRFKGRLVRQLPEGTAGTSVKPGGNIAANGVRQPSAGKSGAVRSRLRLKNGCELDCYWSAGVLAGHLRDGRLVQSEMIREMDEAVIYFWNNRRQLLGG